MIRSARRCATRLMCRALASGRSPGVVKVLLDENFPLPLLDALRRIGIDADHIITLGLRGVSDTEIVKRLDEEAIVLLTHGRRASGAHQNATRKWNSARLPPRDRRNCQQNRALAPLWRSESCSVRPCRPLAAVSRFSFCSGPRNGARSNSLTSSLPRTSSLASVRASCRRLFDAPASAEESA